MKSHSSSLHDQPWLRMKLIIRHQGSSIGSGIVQYNIFNAREEKLGGELVGCSLTAKSGNDSAFGK